MLNQRCSTAFGRLALSAGVLLSAFFSFGCSSATASGGPELNVVSSGGHPYSPTLEQSIERSNLVFVGTAYVDGPARWSTGDGERPGGTLLEIDRRDREMGTRHRIFTPFRIEIEEIWAGTSDTPELTRWQLGGQVDSDVYSVDWADLDWLVDGQRAIFFVQTESRDRYVPQLNSWSLVTRFELDSRPGKAVAAWRVYDLDEMEAAVRAAAGEE